MPRPAGQTANQPAKQLVANLILNLTPKQISPVVATNPFVAKQI